jgi:hypothetical protein
MEETFKQLQRTGDSQVLLLALRTKADAEDATPSLPLEPWRVPTRSREDSSLTCHLSKFSTALEATATMDAMVVS